jgi:predicted amidohydrolase
MRIAAVQLTAYARDEADLALEEALAAIADAAAAGAQLAVLPECTWPAYLLGTDHVQRWSQLPSPDAVVERFAAAAREHAMVLVVGLALPTGPDLTRVANAAVVIDADGTVLHTTHKRFLWDVDALWFEPGTASRVVETRVGRLGVMICADGRMPEIARELALAGAELLVDPTAWVTAGADPATWNNPQAIHMFPTRARENGFWAVAANKVGIERDLVAYCGRSCIVAPDGTVVARASSEHAETILFDVELAPAAPPIARRPELYPLLTAPTASLPVVTIAAQALVPSQASRRYAASALSRGLVPEDLGLLADAGIDLLAVLETPPARLASGVTVHRESPDRAVLLDEHGTPVAAWDRCHGAGAPGERLGPVVATAAGHVGVLLGEDGLVTEAPRVLMLDGADVIVWFSGLLDVAGVAATRAAENRVFLILVPDADAPVSTRILDPNGNPLADAGAALRLISTVVSLDDARRKEMAPGTDVVTGRQPACYDVLTTGAAAVGTGR